METRNEPADSIREILSTGLPNGDAARLWRAALSEALAVAARLLVPGSHVIEIGYGNGQLTCSLAQHLGWRITGYDISASAGESARRNAQRRGVSNLVEFNVSSPFSRPPERGRYDGAFIKTVLYNARDAQQYADWLDWLADSLRPEGIFVILENGKMGFLMGLYRRMQGRSYRNAMLYSSTIEALFRPRFEFLHNGYYGRWCQLVSAGLHLRHLSTVLEERPSECSADNAFIAALVLRRKIPAPTS